MSLFSVLLAGSQLVSNTCTVLRGKTKEGSDTGHDNDACHYLRLAVPRINGASDPKVMCMVMLGLSIFFSFSKP